MGHFSTRFLSFVGPGIVEECIVALSISIIYCDLVQLSFQFWRIHFHRSARSRDVEQTARSHFFVDSATHWLSSIFFAKPLPWWIKSGSGEEDEGDSPGLERWMQCDWWLIASWKSRVIECWTSFRICPKRLSGPTPKNFIQSHGLPLKIVHCMAPHR